MKQYSKRIVKWLFIAWFVTLAFGIIATGYQLVVCPESASLESIFAFVGTPMGAGLVGYLCKAAFENVQKIKNDTEDTI